MYFRKLLEIVCSTHHKQVLASCITVFLKVCKNLCFIKDVERCFVNECLNVNGNECRSNVMDFGTCVANEKVYL